MSDAAPTYEPIEYRSAFENLLEQVVSATHVLYNERIPAAEARGRCMSKLATAIDAAEKAVGYSPDARACVQNFIATGQPSTRAPSQEQGVPGYPREKEDQFEL